MPALIRQLAGLLAPFGGILALVGVGLFCGWLLFKPNADKAKAVQAEQGQQLATETAKAVERVGENTTRIIVQSEQAAHAVETAEGADAPLSPAVRDGFLSGVRGLRERSPVADDQPSR